LYDDSTPGELFITMAKEGSTVGGLMDAFGTAISMCLQYGVPVKSLVEKFAHTRFEPSGFTKNPDIPIAKSLPDYIFRWFGMTFLDGYREPQSSRPCSWSRRTRTTARWRGEGRPGAAAGARHPGPGRVRGGAGLQPHRRPVPALHGRRPRLRHLRRHHGPQRRLLQVLQLRQLDGLLVGRR
jgi:hypothetical protein